MIPEKVTWVRFPARINAVYSKVPPINDLFSLIFNQTLIFAIDFVVDQERFSAMLYENIVCQNKFCNFSPNFFILLC